MTNNNLPKFNFSNELFMTLFGSFLLFFGVAISFYVTEQVAIYIEKWFNNNVIKYIGAGFVLSFCFISLVGALRWMVKSELTDMLLHGKDTMNKAVDNFKQYVFDSNSSSGVISEAKAILKERSKQVNLDVITAMGNYDDIQKKFIDQADILKDQYYLRILGTMLGTYGTNGIHLGEQLVKLAEKHPNEIPFSDIHFCSPGHVGTPVNSAKERSLYPFSARITAGKVLLKFIQYFKEKGISFPGDTFEINISFVEKDDIFPAIQLWGHQAAMILCSTGADDRINSNNVEITAVNEAMPIALMLMREYKLHDEPRTCKLDKTLKRLEEHLVNDFGMDSTTNPETEKWKWNRLEKSFYVDNYAILEEEGEYIKCLEMLTNKDEIVENIQQLKDSQSRKINLQDFTTIINNLEKATLEIAPLNIEP